SIRRADEGEFAVVLVAVEVGPGERGGGGEFGLLQGPGIVVAAEGEFPLRAGLGFAAGRGEALPRNAALDRPAAVLVIVLVECAADLYRRFQAYLRQLREAHVSAGAPRRQEQLQRRPRGVDLELVVRKLLRVGLQKDLEDIIEPRHPVALGDVGV